MKIPTHQYRSPLGRLVAEPRPDPEEIKREGWLDQHILVVSPEDARLDWTEREFLRRIGNRLYGDKERRHG
jgi:hypothetical protein